MLEQVDQKDSIPVHLKLNLTLKEAAEYSNIGINRLSLMISFCLICWKQETNQETKI